MRLVKWKRAVVKARVVSNFNLITIGEDVIEELKKDIVEYQTKTVAEMKSQAPVDTGALSNGINGAITNNGLTSTIEAPAWIFCLSGVRNLRQCGHELHCCTRSRAVR